jgi:GNAT superfamily N-acetyltransferase
VNGISLRRERPEDEPFLIALYASTRATEMARTPWTDAQKSEFLRWQFQLQTAHYRTHYHDADFCIIEEGGCSIWRLYVHRGAQEIRLIDIALLPGWRRRGIGGGLVNALLQEAKTAKLPVSLHIEATNPARRLYYRTEFRHATELGVYERLVWLPPDPAGKHAAAKPGQQQQDGGGSGVAGGPVLIVASSVKSAIGRLSV